MFDRPLCDLQCHGEGVLIIVGEISESFDGLRRALNVYRIRPVVIVTGTSGRIEKSRLEVLETEIQSWPERLIACALDIALETIQIVSRMKVVNPMALRTLCVVPASVG